MVSMFQARGTAEARKRSDEIDKMLKEHARELSRYRKLLLLGTSESGKSTILKQMKLIHRGDLNDYDPTAWAGILVSNLLDCITALAHALVTKGIPLKDAEKKDDLTTVLTLKVQVATGLHARNNAGVTATTRTEADTSQMYTFTPTADNSMNGQPNGEIHGSNSMLLPQSTQQGTGGMAGVDGSNGKEKDLEMENVQGEEDDSNYFAYRGPKITKEVKRAVIRLWNDDGIRECMAHYANEINLLDSAEYLLESAARILDEHYRPTTHDIIRARYPTNSVTETRLSMEGILYKVFDVAGSRKHRHKWVPFFDDCLAIFFVVAISAYDQHLAEDPHINRVGEALDVFEQICNNPLLMKTTMMLFLNKIDLFKAKLKRSQISKYFPDFPGPQEYEAGCKYFARRFLNLNKVPGKSIYVHYTWATDTKQISVVLAVVNKTIVKLNLQAAGFM